MTDWAEAQRVGIDQRDRQQQPYEGSSSHARRWFSVALGSKYGAGCLFDLCFRFFYVNMVISRAAMARSVAGTLSSDAHVHIVGQCP